MMVGPITAGTAAPAAGGGGSTMPPAAGVGAAGVGTAGVGAAGMGTTAGVGAAGMGTTAGAGAAGMGTTAGMGAAGMGTAGTGATAGMGAAGMGTAGMPAFTPGSPTWSAIYQEIVVGTGCNGGPTCHASTAAGQLKMSTKADAYTALVGVKAMGTNLVMMASPNCKDSNLTRVVAGDPMASLFYTKISSATPACGTKMPPSGALLPMEKLEQVRMWIMAGAKND